MLGHGAIGQFAIGQVGAGNPELISADKWFVSLSIPVRTLPRSPAALSPDYFFDPAPSPFVAYGWRQWLSEPVRLKPGIRVELQSFETQSADFLPHPQNFLEGWFNWFSEPQRFKPLLIPADHPPPFYEPYPPIFQTTDWYNWLSEPVRLKRGLSVTLQQTLAYHPRVIPTPNVTGIMNAFALNVDTAQISIYVIQSQPAASASVSITEVVLGQSATSVRER